MISVVLQCIGIALLMISIVVYCNAYDKHGSAVHWVGKALELNCS